jgi:hypothetical protein
MIRPGADSRWSRAPRPPSGIYSASRRVFGRIERASASRTEIDPEKRYYLSPDDSTNGLVVLGVNELDPTITTVAALNDSQNKSRLERTQPSILLSLQVLGGQLLAMALTGERVDEGLLDSVLKIHTEPAAKS